MLAWRKFFIKIVPQHYLRILSNQQKRIRHFLLHRSQRPPFPKNIVVDTCTVCNLKCPLCPTGTGNLKLPKIFMKLQDFKVIFYKIPFVKYISFFNWGEPFLNPDIIEIIKTASRKGVTTGIHSNFSLDFDNIFFKQLVESGLDKLIISLDGVSQENYSAYRVDGQYELVINNIKKLKSIKENKIKIVYKMMVNKYNENDIEIARTKSKELGVEFELSYISLADYFPDNEQIDNKIDYLMKKWLPLNKEYILPRYKRTFGYPLFDEPCFQLFDTTIINPNGTVSPCCNLTDKENVFGDLLKQTFESIWYGPSYTAARSLFTDKDDLKKNDNFDKVICYKCRVYKKRRNI